MSKNLLGRLTQALDEAKIPYIIIGGQAVLLYGEPRLTRDVDVIIGSRPRDLARVLRVVQRVPLRPLVQEVEDFVRQTWVLPTLDEAVGLRVDFIFSWMPYEQSALGRARQVEVEGYPVRFAAPEDVVIHKILAARPRDIEDIRSILRKQPLDMDYIRGWLQQFEEALGKDYLDRFERAARFAE